MCSNIHTIVAFIEHVEMNTRCAEAARAAGPQAGVARWCAACVALTAIDTEDGQALTDAATGQTVSIMNKRSAAGLGRAAALRQRSPTFDQSAKATDLAQKSRVGPIF
jgi:hypothetical protein